MRILIIYHAGAMKNARRIYGALTRAGAVELTIATAQKIKVEKIYEPAGWLGVEKAELSDGYRLVPVPLKNPSAYWQGFEGRVLRGLIEEVQADIIHVLDEPTSRALFQTAWQRFGTSAHSKVLFYGFQNLPIHLGPHEYLKWKLTWSQVAGGAVANSEVLDNLRRAGFPKKRPVERIFWGISTDIFRPMDARALKKELGIRSEYVIGFVGRLAPEKGLTILLRAMGHLPPAVHCLIIGDGPMRAEVDRWSSLRELNGRIHLRDVVEPELLARYMNCMDVLVVPSITTPRWKEQYGRVIGEAMACGVPVVGSNSGAIPEVIGRAGIVVPEGEVSSLADATRTAIFDREVRGRLRQDGLERVEQELSVVTMSKRLIELYRRILET